MLYVYAQNLKPYFDVIMQHNIIQPCGSVPWPCIMSVIFRGSLEQIGNIDVLFMNSGWTWKFGWSHTPGTMHRNYYLSKEHSHETLSIPIFVGIIINSCTENTDIVHNMFMIQTDIGLFLFSNFLPMKIRQGIPMSYAKYKMEQNHSTE